MWQDAVQGWNVRESQNGLAWQRVDLTQLEDFTLYPRSNPR